MSWFAVFRSRRMAALFLLGFSSGLPLMLTSQTLQALLTAAQISLRDIAAMSLVGLALSATQFALLTSLSSVGLRVFGPFADRVVAAVGWSGYFAVCAAMALPGLALVGLATRVAERDPDTDAARQRT